MRKPEIEESKMIMPPMEMSKDEQKVFSQFMKDMTGLATDMIFYSKSESFNDIEDCIKQMQKRKDKFVREFANAKGLELPPNIEVYR